LSSLPARDPRFEADEPAGEAAAALERVSGDGRRPRMLRASSRGQRVTLQADGQLGLAGPGGEATEEDEAAARLLDSAGERAEAIVRRGTEEAARLRTEAVRAGRDDGYREAQAAARAEIAEALELVRAAGADAKALRDSVMRGLEAELVELVVEAARAVIGARAESDRELVVATVERAVERAGRQSVVRIRVHPRDRDVIVATLAEGHGAAAEWEVAEDGAIGVGGCRIDTEAGEVDARLDAQLDEVALMLREAVPHAA
jgi:flagellar assembly protein FliH